MAVMTSYHTERCYYLVSEHEASVVRLFNSVRQFLIYCTFVFVHMPLMLHNRSHDLTAL